MRPLILMGMAVAFTSACRGSHCVAARIPYCDTTGSLGETTAIAITRELSPPTQPLCEGVDAGQNCPARPPPCKVDDPGCVTGASLTGN